MEKMPIDNYNADQLRGFISVARRRLAEITADTPKLAANIDGQESAKRAIQIAAYVDPDDTKALPFDIVFFGPSGAGADKLVILAAQFGVAAYAVKCCPCGKRTDPKRACTCTPGEVRRHWAKVLARPEVLGAAIHCEVRPVTFRQMGQKHGLPYSDMRSYIDQAGPRPFTLICDLDQSCTSIMRQATNELGFPAETVRVVLSIADSIAALDNAPAVKVHHIAEAIQYRRLDRPFD